jgi:hypothetical protein
MVFWFIPTFLSGRKKWFSDLYRPSCRDGRNDFLIYTDLPVGTEEMVFWFIPTFLSGRKKWFSDLYRPPCRDGRNGFLIYTDFPVVFVMMLSVYQTVCVAASVNGDQWMNEWAECVWCWWRSVKNCSEMWQRAGNTKFNTQNEKWISIHSNIPQPYDRSSANSRESSSQGAI